MVAAAAAAAAAAVVIMMTMSDDYQNQAAGTAWENASTLFFALNMIRFCVEFVPMPHAHAHALTYQVASDEC